MTMVDDCGMYIPKLLLPLSHNYTHSDGVLYYMFYCKTVNNKTEIMEHSIVPLLLLRCVGLCLSSVWHGSSSRGGEESLGLLVPCVVVRQCSVASHGTPPSPSIQSTRPPEQRPSRCPHQCSTPRSAVLLVSSTRLLKQEECSESAVPD